MAQLGTLDSKVNELGLAESVLGHLESQSGVPPKGEVVEMLQRTVNDICLALGWAEVQM